MIIIMHGQFTREMPETVDKDKTWKWTRKGDLKVETGTLIFAAHEQPLRTNYVRFYLDKSVDSPLCRLCRQKAGAPGSTQRRFSPKYDENTFRVVSRVLLYL